MNILDNADRLSKTNNKEHFLNLIQVAMADGEIDHKESLMLHKYGIKMGFTLPEIEKLIELTREKVYNPPYKLSKRFEQVYDLVKMALADGIIENSEMRIVTGFATKSGFKENEIANLLVLLLHGIRQGTDEETLFEEFKKNRKS